MPIFQIKNKKNLFPIKETKFKLEKDLQKLTEENLAEVFGLQFVAAEFKLHNFIIDTLVFDRETNSFVIIEYKKGGSFSVIDQGFAYLQHMLNNKADFILEYNEKLKMNLTRESVDWTQSRVIFVANSYNSYQRESINFKDLPIELWEVRKYENNTVLYNQIKARNTSESIKTISKDKAVMKVTKEVKRYSIEDHFKEGWDESKELYFELKDRIMGLGNDIEEKINQRYIAYSRNGKNFAEIVAQAGGLKVYLDISRRKLKDPNRISKDCSQVGHWATGEVVFKIESMEEMEYTMFLVRQGY